MPHARYEFRRYRALGNDYLVGAGWTLSSGSIVGAVELLHGTSASELPAALI